MKIKHRNLYPIALFAAIFLFYSYITYQTPYTGDDWTWGTERGLERLKNNFADYNGRYLSNIIEIVITRYDFLRLIFLAAFSTALVYVIGKLTGEKHKLTFWMFAFIALLLLPTSMYAQTFGWTAGFVNYVPSMVLLLLYLIMVKNIFSETPPTYERWQLVTIVPLGFATQLIVEHVTLYALFIAGVVIIYTYIVHKKLYLLHVLYLASTLVGAIVMFTNSAYWKILQGSDVHTYRNINDEANVGLLRKAYDIFSEDMYRYLFMDNLAVQLFMGSMVVVLVVHFVSVSKWINYLWKPVLLFITVGYLMYMLIFQHTLGDDYLSYYTNDFEAIFSAVYFLTVILSVIVFVTYHKFKYRLLLYLSGIILLSAPFAYVTPYGPRAALGSYIFMVLFALELFLYNKQHQKWRNTALKHVLTAATVVIISCYLIIFTAIGHVNRERLDYLQEKAAVEAEQIYMPDLPFSQFMWFSTPPDEHFNSMFKRFYNVPARTDVIFIPYAAWKEKT